MGCLYRLTFPNGKHYLGITVGTAEARFRGHASHRNSHDLAVTKAIRKFGVDAVTVETLVIGEWDYLCDLERRAIAAFGTRTPHGYNITEGGEGTIGYAHTDETKAKMRACKLGKPLSEEHRRKLAVAGTKRVMTEATRAKLRARVESPEALAKRVAAMQGRVFSPEHCAAIAKWHTGRKLSDAHRAAIGRANVGKVYSAETREKIAASKRGKPRSPETRMKLRLANLGKRKGVPT